MKVEISCPPEFLADTKLRYFLHEILKQYSLVSPPTNIFYENDKLVHLAYHLSDMLSLPCVFGQVEQEDYWIHLVEGRRYAERQGEAEVPLCLMQLDDTSVLQVPISSFHDFCEKHKEDADTPEGEEYQVMRGMESLMKPDGQQGIRVLAVYWSEVINEHYIAFVTEILRGLGTHFDFCYSEKEAAAIVPMMPKALMTLQTLPEDCYGSGRAFLNMQGTMHWVLFCPYNLFKEAVEASSLSESPFILVQNNGQVKYYNYNEFTTFCQGQPAEIQSPSISASLSFAKTGQDFIQGPGIRPLSSKRNSFKRKVKPKEGSEVEKKRKCEAGQLEDDSDTDLMEVDKPSKSPEKPESQYGEATEMRVLVDCGENWNDQSDTDLAEFLRKWKGQFYVCGSKSQFEAVASKIVPYQIVKYFEVAWSSAAEFLGMQGPDNWVWLASSPVLQEIAWKNQWSNAPFLAYRIGNGDLQPYSKPQPPPSSRPQSGYRRPVVAEPLVDTLQLQKKTAALTSLRERQFQALGITLDKTLKGASWRVTQGQSISDTQNQAAALLNEFLEWLLKTCIAKLTELCIQMQTWLRSYEENLLRILMEPITELYGLIAALPSQGLQEAFLRLYQLKQAFETSYSDPSLRQEITNLQTDEAPLINSLYYPVEPPHYNYSLLPAKFRSCPYLIVRTKRPTGQNVLLSIQTNPYVHITTHNRLYLEQEVLFVPLPLKPGEAFNLCLCENEAVQASKQVTLRYAEFEAMEDLDWDGGAEQFAVNQHQNGA